MASTAAIASNHGNAYYHSEQHLLLDTLPAQQDDHIRITVQLLLHAAVVTPGSHSQSWSGCSLGSPEVVLSPYWSCRSHISSDSSEIGFGFSEGPESSGFSRGLWISVWWSLFWKIFKFCKFNRFSNNLGFRW